MKGTAVPLLVQATLLGHGAAVIGPSAEVTLLMRQLAGAASDRSGLRAIVLFGLYVTALSGPAFVMPVEAPSAGLAWLSTG